MTAESSEPRGGGPIPMVLGAGLMVVGAFVPLPGVEHELLAQLGTPVPFLGATAPWLAAIYLVLISRGWHPSPAAQRVAVTLYFVVALTQGLAIAFWLESVGRLDYGLEVVSEPGWRFRILIMLAWAAGAGLVWIAAAAIDRTGRAQGALFLLLLHTCIHFLRESLVIGDAFGRGALDTLSLVRWALIPTAFVAMAFVLAARPVSVWPLELPGTRLRSAWDALALITVGAIPDALITSWFAMSGTPAPSWARWVGVLLGLAVLVQVGRWWWRAGERGNPRPWVPVGYAAVFVSCAVGALVSGFFFAGGLSRTLDPGPLAGDSSFTLVLDADERFVSSDAPAMAERLERLGAEAEVHAASPSSITLRVSRASDPGPVLEALRPLRTSVHLVREIRPEELSVGVRVQVVTPPLAPSGEGVCAELDAWLAAPRDTTRCLYRIEREADPDSPCILHCLDPQAILDADDFAAAQVVFDSFDNRPALRVELTPSAAQRFGDFTGEHLRERLAIAVDREVTSAPVIQSAIPGGVLQITMGYGTDLQATLAEVESLAAALQPGSARLSPWTLSRVE